MRKKMLLCILIPEDGVAPINSTLEFRAIQHILKYSMQLDNFALIFTFWTCLLTFKPLVDALSTEHSFALRALFWFKHNLSAD